MRSRLLSLSIALAAATALAGCGSESGGGGDPKTLDVATHDSWAMSEDVLAAFEAETGITVKVQPQGDAGELTNRLVLTQDSPVADGVYGIDNTFGARAVAEDVLAPYAATALPESAREYRLEGGEDLLTPIDYSDVCVNVDDTWFTERDLDPPRSLDDLTDPAYRGLFVTPGATTSSPGLAFLVATIVAKGDGWREYWERLMANDATITSGWTDAYQVDFTAGGGDGDRPIVTSYSSSPPFTIPEDGERPTTSALLDTCFRQVEYAGVLAGSDNPEGMQQFIDFMLGQEFQTALPDNMYVYPVDAEVALPESWAEFAPPAPDPLTLPAEQIQEELAGWLRDWREITTR